MHEVCKDSQERKKDNDIIDVFLYSVAYQSYVPKFVNISTSNYQSD